MSDGSVIKTKIETTTYRLSCTVNRAPVELDVDPHETVYDTLRERMRLTGTKGACLEGECSSCTILLDGVPVTSCLVLAPQVQGKAITTIEGLASERGLHVVQRSFIDRGAVQCGYCTPGLILSTVALLERTPRPTREQVREGLEGNLCRCTGYMKIVDAVLDAADRLAGPETETR
ncbi:(2Fe-2S)-binding protein [Nannocystaceae bacterium ST9]